MAEAYAKKHNIDHEKLTRLLPKGSSHKVTDEIIELIGKMEEDTGLFQDYMEESFLSHLPVLREVKVSLTNYVNGIKYCNLKKSMTNEKAWEIVFPERYNRVVSKGGNLSSHVAMYNSSPLIVKLDAQMMLNIKIQYAPALHQSIQKEISLMNDPDVSFHVQHLAAKTLIETLIPLEEQKTVNPMNQELVSKDSQNKMLDAMCKIAEAQHALIMQGHSLEEVQKLNLKIEAEEDDGEAEYAEIIEQDETKE